MEDGSGRLQRDQEFSIPGFLGWDFAKSRDPRIFRDGISVKFFPQDFTENVWIWANLKCFFIVSQRHFDIRLHNLSKIILDVFIRLFHLH